jgi:hypothetical protein
VAGAGGSRDAAHGHRDEGKTEQQDDNMDSIDTREVLGEGAAAALQLKDTASSKGPRAVAPAPAAAAGAAAADVEQPHDYYGAARPVR